MKLFAMLDDNKIVINIFGLGGGAYPPYPPYLIELSPDRRAAIGDFWTGNEFSSYNAIDDISPDGPYGDDDSELPPFDPSDEVDFQLKDEKMAFEGQENEEKAI